MNAAEGVLLGIVFTTIVGLGWKFRSPEFLFSFAFFTALAAIASSTGYQNPGEAPYAWAITAALAMAGLILKKIRH